MNNFEFISYKATPNDKFMRGYAVVRCYGKVILKYKEMTKKDGSGTFFAAPSYTIDEGGEKSYVSAFGLDSRMEEEMVMDLIRDGVKKAKAVTSVYVQQAPQSTPFIDRQPDFSQNELPF